jgi:hypothetical protein
MGANVTMDVELTDDAYVRSGTYADSNYGTAVIVAIDGLPGSDICRTYLKIAMPIRPAIASNRKPIAVKIRLAIYQAHTTNGLTTHARRVDKSASQVLESGVTWNKYDGTNSWTTAGGDLTDVLSPNVYIPNGAAWHSWYEWDISVMGLDWEENAWVCLKSTNESLGLDALMQFESCEGNAGYRPTIRITYEDENPTGITDLKVQGDTTDRTKVKLTWSANKNSDFVSYKIRKSASSPVTYTSTLVATVTNQAQTEYTEASANTENTVQYYAVFVEDANNTGANSTKSNEVFAIRPDVSSFTFDDYTPELFQKVTGTITSAAHASTPVPITDDLFYFQWGSGSDPEQSYAWQPPTGTLVSARTHRYPYSTTYHPYGKIQNSLGLESDLTASGSNPVVAAALPIAKIRASNMLAATSETITFYGDESYCPAGDKSITTPNGYAWDWDYTGSFVADEYTTLPVVTHSWGTAGTKTAALQVSDGTNSSATVSMQVTVAAQTTVNLDSALVDGFDSEDYTDGRRASLLEGPEAWEITSGTQMPREVKIGGLAYTDIDVDGIPDDIETLNDIILNGKKVSLTLDGVSRTGIINGPIQKHKEGGYVDKVAWSCAILLE